MENLSKAHHPISIASLPADDAAWGRAMCRAYDLRRESFSVDMFHAELFSAGGKKSIFSSAPYLSDGGIFARECLREETLTELRAFMDDIQAHSLLLKSRFPLLTSRRNVAIDKSYFTLTLDLSDGVDEIWNHKISSKIRNQARKGFQHKPVIQVGGENLLDDFYKLFSTTMRDLGTPTYGKKFFRSILEEFCDQGEIMLMRVPNLGPVSGAFLLTCGDTMFHPYAVTLKSALPLSLNNAFYWELIKYACSKNLKRFDMGRSHRDYGTFRYKKNWAAQPVQLYYNYILSEGVNMPSLEKFHIKLATRVWKRLPLLVTNAIGPHLIRKIL